MIVKLVKLLCYIVCLAWIGFGLVIICSFQEDEFKYYDRVTLDVNARVRSYLDSRVKELYGFGIGSYLMFYNANKKEVFDFVGKWKLQKQLAYKKEVFFERFGHEFNGSDVLDVVGWNEMGSSQWLEFYPEEGVTEKPFGFDSLFYDYIYAKYEKINRGEVAQYSGIVRSDIIQARFGDAIQDELNEDRRLAALWTFIPPVCVLLVLWGGGGLGRRFRAVLRRS
jgi:hypothetical protein